jgi:hypothetical protein
MDRWEGFMKYTAEMGSADMMDSQTQTAWRPHKTGLGK